MWEGEMERNPALGAPGSNTYTGLIASTSNHSIGAKAGKVQALSDEDANALCESYQFLAYKIAGEYRGKGIELEDLRAAGLTGLVVASRKFKPDRGIAFGGYAHYWVRGEITALFKRNNPLDRALSLTVNNKEGEEFQKDVADASPVIAPDLSGLSDGERFIVRARDSGETLAQIGKGLGFSAERIRQIEALARPKIRGAIASCCISDLTGRGKAIRHPQQPARSGVEFCDSPRRSTSTVSRSLREK